MRLTRWLKKLFAKGIPAARRSSCRWARLRLEQLEDRTLPSTFYAQASGDFDNPATWLDQNNNPGVPGASDIAIINTSGITVTSGVNNTVGSLTLAAGATLQVNSGTFSI